MSIKTNIYLFLIFLCFTSIFLMQSLTPHHHREKKTAVQLSFDETKTLKHPLIIGIGSIYFIVFIIGCVNIIDFARRKINKKPFIDFHEDKKTFPLTTEQIAQLFLIVFFLVFLIHVIGSSAHIFNLSLNPLAFSIILNVCFEISACIVFFKFLSPAFLGFHFGKDHFWALLKIYTALIPLLLGALLINNHFLKYIDIEPALNPAIEIFLMLKKKYLVFLLLFQAIILAPLTEEIFFRGFVYTLLRKKHSLLFSASLVSLFFAAVHNTPQDILPLFIISMALCYFYEKTQNIAAPVIFHAIHNGINFILLIIFKNMSGY